MRAKTKRFIVGGSGAAAATAAALVLATGGSRATTGSTRNAGSTANPISAQAKRIALHAAAAAGDNAPTGIDYSRLVTRNQALAAVDGFGQMGGALGTASGYYLLIEHGHFTLTDVSEVGPPTNPGPTGTVLVMTVDSATGKVADSGLLHKASSLHTSSLGPMTPVASS